MTELQVLEFPNSSAKRGNKTSRKKFRKRAATISLGGDLAKDLDMGKVWEIPEEREIIFQASKKKGASEYEIEISEAQGKMYIAAANQTKHKEHYLIELDVEKGEQILQEFKTDFQAILDSLQIISRRLVLLNPNMSENKRAATTKNKWRGRKNMRKMTKRGNLLVI